MTLSKISSSSRENILKKCAREQPKPGIRPNINSGSAVPIVDIHVYVAPDVDDGERDVHELIELLKLAEKQGKRMCFALLIILLSKIRKQKG